MKPSLKDLRATLARLDTLHKAIASANAKLDAIDVMGVCDSGILGAIRDISDLIRQRKARQ